MMNLLRSLVVLAAACLPALAQAECTPVEITGPVRGSTLHEVRPEIRWEARDEVRVYRVQIESRVPESKVIERVDARVSGNRFVPPRPLTDRRAAVKLLVTADCAESESISTQAAWFFIDAASSCAPVAMLSISSASKIAWAHAERATRYEVEVFSLSDGRLIERRETMLTAAELPPTSAPLLVAVRPRCGLVRGEAAYGLRAASR